MSDWDRVHKMARHAAQVCQVTVGKSQLVVGQHTLLVSDWLSSQRQSQLQYSN